MRMFYPQAIPVRNMYLILLYNRTFRYLKQHLMKKALYLSALVAATVSISGCSNQGNTDGTQAGTDTAATTTTASATTNNNTDVTGVGGTHGTINNDGVDSGIDSSAAIEAPIQSPTVSNTGTGTARTTTR